uniref:Zgc:153896 n=1 Tax=Hucho hucho TaxID=62062 RepID=A0A4W5JZA2_9TELE
RKVNSSMSFSGSCFIVLLIQWIALDRKCKPLNKGTHNKLLVISFDGFRWDYDQDVDTPHMDKLVEDGVKAKYITPPLQNAIDLLCAFEPLLHPVIRSIHVMSIPFLLFQGLKTGSFFFPGGGANYSGQCVNRALVEETGQQDDNETEWRQNIDTVLSWFTEEDFDFVTLYYGEPDNVGHAKGPDHPDRKTIIKQIDRTIGYLREAIQRDGLTDNLNVIITSDHGMTTVKKIPLVDEIILSKYLNFFNLVYFELLDYGGFGMITPKKGKEQHVYDALMKAPNLTVYKKEDMPENFHLSKNDRMQPIIVIADLGFNLNSVGRLIVYVNKGDHGFHMDEMDMKTIFRAFGPDFKKSYLSEPFDSVHIYPLMCKLLQIDPAPNNGSLSVTEGMLVQNDTSRELLLESILVSKCMTVSIN